MADSKIPDDLKYTKTDEWIRVQGNEATIGITDYAQNELGDVVYVDLPWDDAGKRDLTADDHFGDIESVKATSPLFAPVAGKVAEVNAALKDTPEIINADPYGAGWMLKLTLPGSADLGQLLDAAAYSAFIKERDH
jgi:glycine cleavage system H protein